MIGKVLGWGEEFVYWLLPSATVHWWWMVAALLFTGSLMFGAILLSLIDSPPEKEAPIGCMLVIFAMLGLGVLIAFLLLWQAALGL